MNLQWGTIAFRLTTPAGDLDFNTSDSARRFVMDDAKCRITLGYRFATTDIPQASGAIFHLPRLQSRTVMDLGIEFWDGAAPACDSVLREMDDLLMLHLMALMTGETGRITWQPSGYPDRRMLDDVLRASEAVPFIEGNSTRGYTFSLDSPFPYALDLTQTLVPVAAGTTVAITNAGTAPFFPVVKANGPTSAFTIINHSVLDVDGNPLEVLYDASRPGAAAIAGGHYAELDFFRNTAYLDGSGANLKPGIDPTVLDFFPINPGVNNIEAVGASCDFLLNNAWGG